MSRKKSNLKPPSNFYRVHVAAPYDCFSILFEGEQLVFQALSLIPSLQKTSVLQTLEHWFRDPYAKKIEFLVEELEIQIEAAAEESSLDKFKAAMEEILNGLNSLQDDE